MLKMKRILCSDWLPERARWAYLVRSGLPALFRNLGVIFIITNPLLTKLFGQDGCLIGLLLFLRFHGPRLRLGQLKRKKRTRSISSHGYRTSLANNACIVFALLGHVIV